MGLYDPAYEHDSCGVACLARLDGQPAHETISRAIETLGNLEHRGAEGADAETGDGAGILTQLPDAFLRAEVEFALPEAGRYAVAVCMLPPEVDRRSAAETVIERLVSDGGQRVLGWRDVPVDARVPGSGARVSMPVIRQLFIGSREAGQLAFERRLYGIRRRAERGLGDAVAFPSFSSRTMVLKGMLGAPQLPRFYKDLCDPRFASALAIVHSRFSTNTFPSWALAHPFRFIAHNGEINTLRGNVNWMRAREHSLGEFSEVRPVIPSGASDSASFDAVLELLVLAGRPLAHAVMMMVPEAWEGREDLPEHLRGFYAYHEKLMEPWDGPASITFSDGRVLGAKLDRNGLRPGRWAQTDDGWVVLASETGALPLEPARVVRRGRLKPGALWIVDLDRGALFADREVECEIASRKPYGTWAAEATIRLEDVAPGTPLPPPEESFEALRIAFGYTREDLEILIGPMAEAGKEPTGSMGADAALPALSDMAPPLFSYFKQRFAQVTNPAIDSLREDLVMSLTTWLGRGPALLDDVQPTGRRLRLASPVLTGDDLTRVIASPLPWVPVDITWPVSLGVAGLEAAIERVVGEASSAAASGADILVLGDRRVGPGRAPIPSLLAVSAVHHSLVRAGLRTRCSLVVDSGEPREVHHVACLVGYGADAVHPWLAGDEIVPALGKGLLKVMSKMGVSTVNAYRGAQVFEAIGLGPELIERHFVGTPSKLGGIGLRGLAREVLERHARTYLPAGGLYRWRRDGERHGWNPDTVAALQRGEWRRYVEASDAAARHGALRGQLAFRDTPSIPLEDVEPATEIMKRFATGAMSLGSISPEAHESLALAMNEIGGRSNTGEGGEDPARFADARRSAIKQVASARFGVTVEYLVNADELQIKVAQGAKPGEGGQLPGHKVDAFIGRLRHATPGVELISPPPHHDIYSIEDLKQLIHDLRCANPSARISVKLAAEAGVGTVAAGVVKAHADHIVIAGHDGGTGASPQSSLVSTGVPWELGLAETQQTLVRNGLRSRVVLQADGGMRTGRDVVIAALLGAEEVGASTAPLVALGCIMMRVCHLNTCPVGIATQDPELRERFAGKPEHVVRFFTLLAEDVRVIMASLGIARFADLVGRVDLLRVDRNENWKASGLDLTPLLAAGGDGERCSRPASFRPDAPIDEQLIAALPDGRVTLPITNVDRTVGGMLSGEIVRRGIEVDLKATFRGSAGQSFGAWLTSGVELTVYGDVNDYAGKGLSGGVIAVRPDADARAGAEEDVIAGNTTLYGATAGRAFFRGLAGERFAVRNSGADAVVEGVGDHCCEYMTGGHVVVIGPTGRNFAAGMSGGIAYVLDVDGDFATRCNQGLVGLETLDPDDTRLVYGLLLEHRRRTGSRAAANLLAHFGLAPFVKVIPHDYKRALERSHALAEAA
ncbi:glutamate synthase large subunit [Solirubrobacter ginsenosidimutans]|uniref:Glutamate synthase large subunit n=1 Tax=Solirubrobacter ginsenosidimutans TaxID=490573 RepID=A0A9X3S5Q7_9ACTN|nr:glutamate synthase large subunit [Solirubrobacter ginsenosidimutans]MDA0165857.1 glutamate synthase large subunit [Solirubrobacter ginsenosidimutans]